MRHITGTEERASTDNHCACYEPETCADIVAYTSPLSCYIPPRLACIAIALEAFENAADIPLSPIIVDAVHIASCPLAGDPLLCTFPPLSTLVTSHPVLVPPVTINPSP